MLQCSVLCFTVQLSHDESQWVLLQIAIIVYYRHLLTPVLPVLPSTQLGILHHTDLCAFPADRGALLGVLLALLGGCTCPCGAGHHDSPHHDNPYLFHQCLTPKDLLPEEHRCLPGYLLCHGLWCYHWVCFCKLHWKLLETTPEGCWEEAREGEAGSSS